MKSYTQRLRSRLQEHRLCTRFNDTDMRLLNEENPFLSLEPAIRQAKAALVGNSFNAEHDALVKLVKALGEGKVPECNCESGPQEIHGPYCPCSDWEAK